MKGTLLGAWSKSFHFHSEMFTYSNVNALCNRITRNYVFVLFHSAYTAWAVVPRVCPMVAWGETGTWQLQSGLARQLHRLEVATSIAAMQKAKKESFHFLMLHRKVLYVRLCDKSCREGEQRATAGRDPELSTPKNRHPVRALSRAVPEKPPALVSRHGAHHKESLGAALHITFLTEGSCCLGVGPIRDAGKQQFGTFQDLLWDA